MKKMVVEPEPMQPCIVYTCFACYTIHSFPAVVLTLGPSRWFELRNAYHILTKDQVSRQYNHKLTTNSVNNYNTFTTDNHSGSAMTCITAVTRTAGVFETPTADAIVSLQSRVLCIVLVRYIACMCA
jgi:hypothetical protein